MALPIAIWPVERPADWVQWVNEPPTDAELDTLRKAVAKGRPFGETAWQDVVIARLGLESTQRERGRPGKKIAKIEAE